MLLLALVGLVRVARLLGALAPRLARHHLDHLGRVRVRVRVKVRVRVGVRLRVICTLERRSMGEIRCDCMSDPMKAMPTTRMATSQKVSSSCSSMSVSSSPFLSKTTIVGQSSLG